MKPIILKVDKYYLYVLNYYTVKVTREELLILVTGLDIDIPD